ncbi:MAG: hypothetical protein DME26_01710 [Verrucomicrobia bacterium]|nr:MAG: hypothetical protein DME26_01710 [Verrucomicrobiota bacterium]
MLTAAESVNLESPGIQSQLDTRENRAAILLVLVLVLVLENPGKIEDGTTSTTRTSLGGGLFTQALKAALP